MIAPDLGPKPRSITSFITKAADRCGVVFKQLSRLPRTCFSCTFPLDDEQVPSQSQKGSVLKDTSHGLCAQVYASPDSETANSLSLSTQSLTTPRLTSASDGVLLATIATWLDPAAKPAIHQSTPSAAFGQSATSHQPLASCELAPTCISDVQDTCASHISLILSPPLFSIASAPDPAPVDFSLLTATPRAGPAAERSTSSPIAQDTPARDATCALPLSLALSAPAPLTTPTPNTPTTTRVLACGSAEDLGERRCMEDAAFTTVLDEHDALPRQMGTTGPVLVAGVFDGHNGDAASVYLREHSMRLLRESAQQLGSSGLPATPAAVLRDALAAAERELVAEGCAGPVAGSTALLVLAAPDQKQLWAANVGDCRLALSTMGPSGFASTSVATVDHRPADNPAERDRLANAGVPVDSSGYISHPAVAVGTGNDMGCTEPLQLSRSLGDRQFKTAAGCTLLSTPDIAEHQLGGDVQFLVLATDGVWDKLRPNEACKVVRQALEGRTGAEDDAARALVQAVRKQPGPDDNAAVIVVRLADITKRVSRFNRGPAA